MILLDTNHLSALQGRAGMEILSERMSASDDWVFGAPVICVEEQFKGWLAFIHRNPGT